MKSTTTLYLKHKTTGALEIITLTAQTGNLHRDLFPTAADALQVAALSAAHRIGSDWTVQHQTTTDTPAASQAEGSDCT